MVFDRLKALFGSKRVVAAKMARFEKWLVTVSAPEARAMFNRVLSRPRRMQVSTQHHNVDTSTLPPEAAAFFGLYQRVNGGGVVLDFDAIVKAEGIEGGLVIGTDIEHARVVLLNDDSVIVADDDPFNATTAPFAYPTVWHYLLDVDAFSYPEDSEAARLAAA